MSLLFPEVKQRVTLLPNDERRVRFEFDASVAETHTGNADITDFPVEDGSQISDHVRKLPEELQINGIVSDHPPILLRSIFAKPAVTDGDSRNRAKSAYDALKRWKDEGKLFSVTTTLRKYQNMAITGLSVARDKDTGNLLNANLTMREIVTAKTELVPGKEPVEAKAGRKQSTNLGKNGKTQNPTGSETDKKAKESAAAPFGRALKRTVLRGR